MSVQISWQSIQTFSFDLKQSEHNFLLRIYKALTEYRWGETLHLVIERLSECFQEFLRRVLHGRLSLR